MKSVLSKTLLTASVALAAGALALPASARTMPAIIGSAVNSTTGACFTNWYGDVVNTCTTTQTWQIPIVADSAGNYTVVVTARSNNLQKNVACKMVSVDRLWDSGQLNLSNTASLSAFGSYQNLVLSGSNLPSWGMGWVECYVDQGVMVHELSY